MLIGTCTIILNVWASVKERFLPLAPSIMCLSISYTLALPHCWTRHRVASRHRIVRVQEQSWVAGLFCRPSASISRSSFQKEKKIEQKTYRITPRKRNSRPRTSTPTARDGDLRATDVELRRVRRMQSNLLRTQQILPVGRSLGDRERKLGQAVGRPG